jgi:hypothetical protein
VSAGELTSWPESKGEINEYAEGPKSLSRTYHQWPHCLMFPQVPNTTTMGTKPLAHGPLGNSQHLSQSNSSKSAMGFCSTYILL